MNKSIFEDVDTKLSQSEINICFHIITTTLIIVITLIGNGSVILIFHQKKMINGSNSFIIAFAFIDILSATLIAPQICFDVLVEHSGYHSSIRREVFIVIVNLSILSNVGLLCAVAIDRAWAVFKPFTYSANKRRHRQTIITILSVCVLQTTIHVFAKQLFPTLRFIFPIQISIGIFILLGTYPAIVYKLFKGSREVAPRRVFNKRKDQRPTITKTSMYVSYISERNVCDGKE